MKVGDNDEDDGEDDDDDDDGEEEKDVSEVSKPLYSQRPKQIIFLFVYYRHNTVSLYS